MLLKMDRLSHHFLHRDLYILVFHLLLTHICTDAASSPNIRLLGLDKSKGGVILHCQSNGWKGEPEMFWLGIEGNLTSDGPTETDRGLDGLYTVSSSVTVEKRHGNSFTCRVTQKKTIQTRETQIYIPDDFFEVQPSCSTNTVGLSVGLAVCILIIIILLIGFILWRKKKTKTKGSNMKKTDKGQRNSDNGENQFAIEDERERQTLMQHEPLQLTEGKGPKKNKHNKRSKQWFQEEEKQMREKQQRRVEEQRRQTTLKTLQYELETKKTELEKKQSELREEKQRNEEKLRLKEELEKKNKELANIRANKSWLALGRKQEEQKMEEEVEKLKTELESQMTILIDDKQEDVRQLQDEIKRMEDNLQRVKEELKSSNIELANSERTMDETLDQVDGETSECNNLQSEETE